MLDEIVIQVAVADQADQQQLPPSPPRSSDPLFFNLFQDTLFDKVTSLPDGAESIMNRINWHYLYRQTGNRSLGSLVEPPVVQPMEVSNDQPPQQSPDTDPVPPPTCPLGTIMHPMWEYRRFGQVVASSYHPSFGQAVPSFYHPYHYHPYPYPSFGYGPRILSNPILAYSGISPSPAIISQTTINVGAAGAYDQALTYHQPFTPQRQAPQRNDGPIYPNMMLNPQNWTFN